MNGPTLELFRVCLLQQLRAVAPADLPVGTLVIGAQAQGFAAASAETVRSELVYLLDKDLVVVPERIVSPENKRWRITAAGRDFLAEAGL
jgi:hypothetical protein